MKETPPMNRRSFFSGLSFCAVASRRRAVVWINWRASAILRTACRAESPALQVLAGVVARIKNRRADR
jgi:hypothetical protein